MNRPASPEHSKLGKETKYSDRYDPEQLFAVPRSLNRDPLGINPQALPFNGYDVWHHYEVSWLNPRGKPIAAIATIIYGCDTENIIESKSMKLYFNSFNNTEFSSKESVTETIKNDLSKYITGDIDIHLTLIHDIQKQSYQPLEGICLDTIEVDCHQYELDPTLLRHDALDVTETLYSHLLRSNCLITGQPDWGSVKIVYQGNKINHASLLQYLVSYRNHSGFAEHCIEQIFMDILQYCKPKSLSVYGCFTRRGGIDINPVRSTELVNRLAQHTRIYRQ